MFLRAGAHLNYSEYDRTRRTATEPVNEREFRRIGASGEIETDRKRARAVQ